MSERDLFQHEMSRRIVSAPPGQPIDFSSREMRAAWEAWQAARKIPRAANASAECGSYAAGHIEALASAAGIEFDSSGCGHVTLSRLERFFLLVRQAEA